LSSADTDVCATVGSKIGSPLMNAPCRAWTGPVMVRGHASNTLSSACGLAVVSVE